MSTRKRPAPDAAAPEKDAKRPYVVKPTSEAPKNYADDSTLVRINSTNMSSLPMDQWFDGAWQIFDVKEHNVQVPICISLMYTSSSPNSIQDIYGYTYTLSGLDVFLVSYRKLSADFAVRLYVRRDKKGKGKILMSPPTSLWFQPKGVHFRWEESSLQRFCDDDEFITEPVPCTYGGPFSMPCLFLRDHIYSFPTTEEYLSTAIINASEWPFSKLLADTAIYESMKDMAFTPLHEFLSVLHLYVIPTDTIIYACIDSDEFFTETTIDGVDYVEIRTDWTDFTIGKPYLPQWKRPVHMFCALKLKEALPALFVPHSVSAKRTIAGIEDNRYDRRPPSSYFQERLRKEQLTWQPPEGRHLFPAIMPSARRAVEEAGGDISRARIELPQVRRGPSDSNRIYPIDDESEYTHLPNGTLNNEWRIYRKAVGITPQFKTIYGFNHFRNTDEMNSIIVRQLGFKATLSCDRCLLYIHPNYFPSLGEPIYCGYLTENVVTDSQTARAANLIRIMRSIWKEYMFKALDRRYPRVFVLASEWKGIMSDTGMAHYTQVFANPSDTVMKGPETTDHVEKIGAVVVELNEPVPASSMLWSEDHSKCWQ